MGFNRVFCRNPSLSYLPSDASLVTKEERAKQKWPVSHLAHKWDSVTIIIMVIIRETESLHVLASRVRLTC